MNPFGNILGKLEDAGKVVRGGRIDQHWGEVDLFPKEYIGVNQILKNDWLHDTQKAVNHFNLRSIEFGNWMNQEDRANFLYATALSLHHLARLLNVADNKIGLGGRLSISLGARGKGNAAGHYEPNPYAVINITKTKGIGVLAHEFAHAVDNLISYHVKSHQTYVSGGRTTRKYFDEEIAEKGNYYEKQFEEFFNILLYDIDGEKSDFHQELDKLDDYWNRRNEIFARTFEVYILEKLRKEKITNHFLVLGTNYEAYPTVDKMQEVSRYIGNIVGKGFHLFRENSQLKGIDTYTGYEGFRTTLKKNSSLDDTLENMQRIAKRDAYQVQSLARELKGKTVAESSENIWDYLRANTHYKLDNDGIEELRTPARSLHDGKLGLTNSEFGIDCDDYTILVSAILINLGISHEYRIVAYRSKGKFQHIYPVAFDEQGNEYIIDCVPEIPHFNYEAQPIIDIKTISMELHELSGIEDNRQELIEELNQPFELGGIDESDELLDAGFLSGLGEVDSEAEAEIVLSGAEANDLIESGLLAEVIKAKDSLIRESQIPTVLSQTINVEKELEILNDLAENWQDDEERHAIIEEAIAQNSPYKNFYKALQISLDELENSLHGIDDEDEIYLARISMDEEDDDLGRRTNRPKKKGRLKNLLKKVGGAVKKGIKAAVRFNPATITLRNTVLSHLKLNAMGISAKLIYGYLSESQAKAQKLDMNEWRKLKDVVAKGEKAFEKIGGKAKNFRNAIVKGRAAKKTGLQLGVVPIVGGVIKVITGLLKNVNIGNLLKKKDKTPAEQEMVNSSPATASTDYAGDENLPADEFDAESGGSYSDKAKSFFEQHKQKIIIGGVGFVVIIIAIVTFKKLSKKKKNQLRGIKAARTRKRNASRRGQLKGAPKRTYTRKKATSTTRKRRKPKQLGRGSTTIIKHPTKGKGKPRMTIRTSKDRFKMMHSIAQDLKKKHPNTKYSTLLSKASKMIS